MKQIENQVEYRPLKDLHELENNPRQIKKDQFERLKQSIKDNPDYFEARPLILSDRTGELVILAGNQRYKAAKALGITEVPTILLPNLTEEREKEIIIRDNVNNGEWDMDVLANEWDSGQLNDWGVDLAWAEPEAPLTEEELLDEDVLPQSFSSEPVENFDANLAIEIPDQEQYEKLKAALEKCDNPELKKILSERLKDFKLFNFDFIANYYLGGGNRAGAQTSRTIWTRDRNRKTRARIGLPRTRTLRPTWRSTQMTFLIIAKEMGGMTSRLLTKLGLDFKYVACDCQKDQFDADKTFFYKCHKMHGSAIARKEALKIKGDYVVLDDDYSSFQWDGYADQKWNKTKSYDDGEDVENTITLMRRLEDLDDKFIIGGYSSGSLCGFRQRIKKNIMQIYISDRLKKFFRDRSDLYRLNDDVCACMIANRMGYLTLGLWGVLRVTQQPEQTDNTNAYDARSWAKSYMPILYYPAAAKISFSNDRELADGSIRPMRFHHRVEWTKIVPRVVERKK